VRLPLTVNVAASKVTQDVRGTPTRFGRRGVRAAESPIRHPAELRGVPISVGHQSAATLDHPSARAYIPAKDIKLSFAAASCSAAMESSSIQGPRRRRLQRALLFLEQLGFRKIIDSTFIIASMLNGEPAPEDSGNTSARLARRNATSTCARALHASLRPRVPGGFLGEIDPRRWGPGERIVFEPYTS